MVVARTEASSRTGIGSCPWCTSSSRDREICSRRRSRCRDVRLRHDLIPLPWEQAVEGHSTGAEAHGSDTACSGPDAAWHALHDPVRRDIQPERGPLPPADAGRGMEPARRDTGWQQSHRRQERGFFSDVYVLNRFGTVTRQLTSNRGRIGMNDPSSNHWSFYPRLSPDGQTLWTSYDGNKCTGCLVIMFDIWAMPINGTMRQARLWTSSSLGTGGDVQPLPVRQGGVIYTKYNYDDQGRLTGQLWYTSRAGSAGRALTSQAEDCRTPALSPDGGQLAMICTYEKQVSYLTLASWTGSSLGPRKALITDQLVAQPTW